MLGGSVEVWTKNIVYWLIKGQTRGTPRGTKTSLALNELKQVALYSTLLPNVRHKCKELGNFQMQNNQQEIMDTNS